MNVPSRVDQLNFNLTISFPLKNVNKSNHQHLCLYYFPPNIFTKVLAVILFHFNLKINILEIGMFGLRRQAVRLNIPAVLLILMSVVLNGVKNANQGI